MAYPIRWTRQLPASPPPWSNEVGERRLEIHAFRPELRNVWLDLHQSVFLDGTSARRWHDTRFDREFLERSWWEPERMLLARDAGAGAWVGSITVMGPIAQAMSINWLAVAPNWRRQGIGRRLVQAAEARIWQCGGRQVHAETLDDWQAACQLYQRLGYVINDDHHASPGSESPYLRHP